MTILRQGDLTICTANNNYLEEQEKKYCVDLALMKAQKENPDLFWKIVEQERQRLLLQREEEKEQAPPVQFHMGSTLLSNTDTTGTSTTPTTRQQQQNNANNVLKMCVLMRKIAGGIPTDNYYVYDDNMMEMTTKAAKDKGKGKEVAEFHKASTDTADVEDQQQVLIRNLQFMKRIAGLT